MHLEAFLNVKFIEKKERELVLTEKGRSHYRREAILPKQCWLEEHKQMAGSFRGVTIKSKAVASLSANYGF
jgi:hypothetical protein